MKHTDEQLLYYIALSRVNGIGPVAIKNLIAYCGSGQAVFKSSKAKLLKVPGIGEDKAQAILDTDLIKEAETELNFIDKYQIKPLFFTDADYPQRLKDCNDAPAMLYFKGNADLNAAHVIAVVGTRKATDYGKDVTRKLMKDLQKQGVLVVSGLAYGIDITAHQAALDNDLPTVGVLGHGLNKIYPAAHKTTASKMVENGGLLTEYLSTDEMHPSNFPNRNRIVAGMSDVTIVIESAIEGGALLTANIAYTYNRDVAAFPGRTSDKYSSGCNYLIKHQKAILIESAEDLLREMNWQTEAKDNKPKQRVLALDLSSEELRIYEALKSQHELDIDALLAHTGLPSGKLANLLLEMEMNGLLSSLPGKRYRWC